MNEKEKRIKGYETILEQIVRELKKVYGNGKPNKFKIAKLKNEYNENKRKIERLR